MNNQNNQMNNQNNQFNNEQNNQFNNAQNNQFNNAKNNQFNNQNNQFNNAQNKQFNNQNNQNNNNQNNQFNNAQNNQFNNAQNNQFNNAQNNQFNEAQNNQFNNAQNNQFNNNMNKNQNNMNDNNNNMNMNMNNINNNMNMNNNMNNMNNMNNNMNMNMNKNMNNMNNMNNNLNNINNNPPDLNSFARFTKATNTGLTNQGNTSYLNAVLQLIGSIRNFASYFTKEKNKQYFLSNVGNCPLAFVTHRLFLHLYKYPENQERETYTPDSYLKVLQMKNLTYKTGKNRNPNDLLTFILDGLHSELNQLKNNNIITPKNTSDKDNVCKCGIMDFQNRHKSVVSNLFNWFQLKEASCGACNNTTYSFHTYNTFDLDILGCHNSNNNNPISINKCLFYSSMGKYKKSYCNKCRKYTQMLFSSKIYCSPNTFIFLLNRGNMDQNLMKIRN